MCVCVYNKLIVSTNTVYTILSTKKYEKLKIIINNDNLNNNSLNTETNFSFTASATEQQ